MSYKLIKKIIISGKIEVLTGLAIGGSNAAMSIGGIDKGVVRNPINNQPYIPGSTLKGKMRSLLEQHYGEIGNERMGIVEHGASNNPAHHSAKLFGNAVREMNTKQRPSKLIVRDANLDPEQLNSKFFKNTELPYSEVKTEVTIDRITSRAMPRQLERVPSGAKFLFELVLNVFDEDNENELVSDLFKALNLVQNDYIGGSGSRGSGQIAFRIETVSERTNAYYNREITEEATNKTSDYATYFPK
jgi:CRISPR-associated protein Csm3